MAKELKTAKRTVTAPGTTAPMRPGGMLSVEVGPDEDVEWVWSHDLERGSIVVGFDIADRKSTVRSDESVD